jgi:DNA-binding transcriptional ArsR family regulator
VPGLSEPEVGDVFAALADPTRRQVVRSLAGREAVTASGLAGELPMTRQAIAKHLAALERAGLVAPRREGRETRYRLTPEPLEQAIAWMTDVGADDRRRRPLGPLARAPHGAGAILTLRPPVTAG